MSLVDQTRVRRCIVVEIIMFMTNLGILALLGSTILGISSPNVTEFALNMFGIRIRLPNWCYRTHTEAVSA